MKTWIYDRRVLSSALRQFRRNRPQRGMTTSSPARKPANFRVVEHVVPTQHTRHWPRGVDVDASTPLRLAVKQYIPHDNPEPQPGDITFIGAHANGFPKELYEPLWDDLYEEIKAHGTRKIRSIWIADIANQGESYALNELAVGNDPNWFDHSRDLLFLINMHQKDMPQPLVGIGHSVGGAQLAQLALMHPRLLQALVLVDPVIQTENPAKSFIVPSTYRRDLWPSREVAMEKFGASNFYQAWDKRVLEKWVEYGLQELPTAAYPDTPEQGTRPVTLSTPVPQECFMYLRPKYYGNPMVSLDQDRLEYGDIHPDDIDPEDPFYRPEPAKLFRQLPEIKPPVLYVFGERSEVATPDLRREKLERTGVGVGGSGGKQDKRVEEVVLDTGHLVPMEKTKETASAVAPFALQRVEQWEAEVARRLQMWAGKTWKDRVSLEEQWKERVGKRPARLSTKL